MSARNYKDCPRCRKRAAALKEDRHARAASQYGKVTAENYQKMLAHAESAKAPTGTLGEYYENWFDDTGAFRSRYEVHCDECGFTFKTTSVTFNAVKDE